MRNVVSRSIQMHGGCFLEWWRKAWFPKDYR